MEHRSTPTPRRIRTESVGKFHPHQNPLTRLDRRHELCEQPGLSGSSRPMVPGRDICPSSRRGAGHKCCPRPTSARCLRSSQRRHSNQTAAWPLDSIARRSTVAGAARPDRRPVSPRFTTIGRCGSSSPSRWIRGRAGQPKGCAVTEPIPAVFGVGDRSRNEAVTRSRHHPTGLLSPKSSGAIGGWERECDRHACLRLRYADSPRPADSNNRELGCPTAR
jgi:hypothetical protein